ATSYRAQNNRGARRLPLSRQLSSRSQVLRVCPLKNLLPLALFLLHVFLELLHLLSEFWLHLFHLLRHLARHVRQFLGRRLHRVGHLDGVPFHLRSHLLHFFPQLLALLAHLRRLLAQFFRLLLHLRRRSFHRGIGLFADLLSLFPHVGDRALARRLCLL